MIVLGLSAAVVPRSTIEPASHRIVGRLGWLLRRMSATDSACRLGSTKYPLVGYSPPVEPTAHALPVHNVFREDIVEPSLPLEKVLQNAPDSDGPFFKVPKVIGGDEDSAG